MTDVHHVDAALERLIVDDRGRALELPADGIGAPQRRLDGIDKVTGRAAYAGESMPIGTLHAVLVTSRVAKGTLRSIDSDAARSAPGVVRVITPDDMPTLGRSPVPPTAQSFVPMSD